MEGKSYGWDPSGREEQDKQKRGTDSLEPGSSQGDGVRPHKMRGG